MSVEDPQDIPYPDVGNEPNSVSCILSYPVSSSSYSLEDGEIMEGHFSGSIVDSELPPLQPSDQPESHLPDQARTSMPAEPVSSLAPTPTVEPSNTLSLSCLIPLGCLFHSLFLFFGLSDGRGPGSSKVPRAGSPWVGRHPRVLRRMRSLSGRHLQDLHRPPTPSSEKPRTINPTYDASYRTVILGFFLSFAIAAGLFIYLKWNRTSFFASSCFIHIPSMCLQHAAFVSVYSCETLVQKFHPQQHEPTL